MEVINKKVTKSLLVASFVTIPLLFNSSKSLAAVVDLSPKGYIDTPVTGAILKGQSDVNGWFLDGNGVSKVQVLVDGKLMGDANIGLPRLDVQNAFPAYQDGNSGYHYSLNTNTLSNGQHNLTVQETAKNGTVTSLNGPSINVQNSYLPAKGYIDAPTAGSVISGVTNVNGWFLDGSGVSKIEVLVDGKSIGTAQYNIDRSDVATAYPAYQNTKSGYQYALDTRNLSNGLHSISVKETGNNGTTTIITTQNMNVKNLGVLGCLDAPVTGSTINGQVTVRGWALDGSGVSKVEVLVDGNSIGTAQYGLDRTDVAKAYPSYQNTKSGYQYTLDTRAITNGQHQVTVRETGNNGTATVLGTSTVNVNNLPAIGSIDSPSPWSAIQEGVTVQGWALDGSGVSKVEVLVDGNSMGTAQLGITRPDVANAYPDYQNAASGYKLTLSTKGLTNGPHTLLVRQTGNNGMVKVIGAQSINVQNFPAKGWIDSPGNNATVNGSIAVNGWFIDGSNVSKVEVLVDGATVGQAQYGGSRPDVAAAFPNYQNANSGYQFTLDTLQFADGPHVLSVKETGTNGSTSTIADNIFVSHGNPYAIIDLRRPANITATDIVNFFYKYSSSSPLLNDAQSFIDAQNKYGVNAQYLVSHAIWETGWGTSTIYKNKHNLFGYGAYDSDPYTNAYYFPTDADSINFEAYIVRKNYLEPTGVYYNGSNLTGMNVDYASDQNWVNGISNLMGEIKPFDYGFYSRSTVLPACSIAPPTFGTIVP